MKQKEYIGITGFKYNEEINDAVRAFDEAGITAESSLTAMIGVLINEKQAGNTALEGRRFPSVENLGKLLSNVPGYMLPTMHYCSSSRTLDVDKLTKVLKWNGNYKGIKAIQLNLDWPAASGIAKLKERFPDIYIIQQVNPDFPSVNAAEKVMQYEGIVDKLLIDPSLGAGKLYDIRQTSELINEIASKTDKFSYVVCGGLDAANVYGRIQEAKRFVNAPFSIDAEGRLRTFDGNGLEFNSCRSYVMNATKAFSRYR